jgi:hypothetical protein
MDSLISVGGDLFIDNNEILTDFTGLQNLESIGGTLRINGNDSLNSLANLDNLTSVNGISIGGAAWVNGNHALNSLAGLENIDAGTISTLYITFNSLLSNCEVQSLCDYLASPNGTIEIHDNASGCNSQAEVEEACEASGIEDLIFSDQVFIYPNPFTSTTTIAYKLQQPSTVQITFYNHLGKQLAAFTLGQMGQGKHAFSWEPCMLQAGVYFAVLKTDNGMKTVKMMKMK